MSSRVRRAGTNSSSDDIESCASSSKRKSRAPVTTGSSSSANDQCWSFLKKLMVLSGVVAFIVNVHALLTINQRFAMDFETDILEFARPLTINVPDTDHDPLGTHGGRQMAAVGEATAKSRPPNRVLKILQLLEREEMNMRPPNSLKRVVVLGKSFIMKRDFSIWETTFGSLGFEVVATNKQELTLQGQDTWNIMLCLDLFDGKAHCIEPNDLPQMRRWQKISRLIGLRKTLWNKDKFCETMGAALKGFKNYTEFVFPCWNLPYQFDDMITEVRERYQNAKFILKPTDRGEGNGIIVMDSYRKLANWKLEFPSNDEVVVQTYLNDPMLIKERKWDMRTYILVTSIHPLRAYMFRDGLARFASAKYDKDAKDGGKKQAILTNTSVNKKTGQSVEDLTWPYPQVYEYLKKQGNVDPDMLWKRIERAITQVLMSSESAFLKKFKSIRNDYTCSNCYQLLGVDVIVDASIIPRIIEVNGEPSMELSGEVNSHYDHTKKSMTRDLVNLLFSSTSYAKELTQLLYELELDGWNVGYMGLGGCTPTDDICLRTLDLQYLLDFVKEDHNMGGFRRLYPTADGEYYTRFLKHLDTRLPYGTLTSTLRMHKLATTLARCSKVVQNNAIEDDSYKSRTGGLSRSDDDED